MSEPESPTTTLAVVTVPPTPVLPEAISPSAPAWPLIAIGMLYLAWALYVLVMAVQTAFAYARFANFVLSGLLIFALAFECVLLAVLVPLGIGLVRRRNWARIGGAVVSILYEAFQLLVGFTTPLPPGATTASFVGRALLMVAMLGVGVPVIWYLLSRHARRACVK